MANSVALVSLINPDILSVSKALQLVIHKVNELSGLSDTAVASTKQLSKLEQSASDVSSVPALASRITEVQQNLTAQIAETKDEVQKLSAKVEQLAVRLSALVESDGLVNFDFNDNSWGSSVGVKYSTATGIDLLNPPTALSAAKDYDVYVSTISVGAFVQTVQLVGNSQNRVFRRAGSDFYNAIIAGWKEL